MRFASRTRCLEGEVADAVIVHDQAMERFRRGEDVILLSIGDPDFETPESGMCVFADVRGTGMDGKRFAAELLDATGVAVTPGEGVGPRGAGHVRITLGTGEARLAEACDRIAELVQNRAKAPTTTH